jgi:hypothetical protein
MTLFARSSVSPAKSSAVSTTLSTLSDGSTALAAMPSGSSTVPVIEHPDT